MCLAPKGQSYSWCCPVAVKEDPQSLQLTVLQCDVSSEAQLFKPEVINIKHLTQTSQLHWIHMWLSLLLFITSHIDILPLICRNTEQLSGLVSSLKRQHFV